MRLKQNVIHNLKFRRILNSPNSALIMDFIKKKRHGSFYFSPIPALRPSHCLNSRISNATSPRPVDYIYKL